MTTERNVPDRIPTDVFTPVGSMWLTYRTNGRTSTGILGSDGVSTTLQEFQLDRDWGHVLALSGRRLVFFHLGTGTLTTGVIDADGRYSDLHDNPNFTAYKAVTTDQDFLVTFRTVTGPQGYLQELVVGKILPSGSYEAVSEPSLVDLWPYVVALPGGVLFFYDNQRRIAATGRVTAQGAYVDLGAFTNFDVWDGVAATSTGTLWFYNADTGLAASGRVDAAGVFGDLWSVALGQGWSFVPTADGRLLISRSATAADIVVARFDASGVFTDGQYVTGMGPGLPSLFLR